MTYTQPRLDEFNRNFMNNGVEDVLDDKFQDQKMLIVRDFHITSIAQAEKEALKTVVTEDTSDGYHTFKELYEHRITIYIALCKSLNNGNVWRSKLHSDGSSFDGWFILGINKEKGKQITYHLPNKRWEETNFAETLDKAPDFDEHTSEDVLKRLSSLDKEIINLKE